MQDSPLAYEEFCRFGDPTRFFRQTIGNSVYLYDQNSGEVFSAEREFLPLFEARNEHEFTRALRILPAGLAEASAQYFRDILDQEDRQPQEQRSRDKVVNVKLNLDTACNLRCVYCFRDESAKRAVSLEAAKKTIEYALLEVGRNAVSQSIGVNLSGEPLLNGALIRELKEHVRKVARRDPARLRNVGFFFLTNGTISDRDAVKAVKKTRNEPYLHISIDGPREVHDRMRRRADGKGSYDDIVASMKAFKKAGLGLKAEAVLTPAYPKPLEVALHLIGLGFDRVNIKPVRKGSPVSFGDGDLAEWKAGYDEYFRVLEEELTDGRLALFQALRDDFAVKYFERILRGHKVKNRCSWGLGGFSMDAQGDYYPCDAVMGMEAYKVGSAEAGLDWEDFHADTDCEKRGECRLCWARHLCGGTCHAVEARETGNHMAIDPIECRMNMYLIEKSLALICALKESGFDFSRVYSR